MNVSSCDRGAIPFWSWSLGLTCCPLCPGQAGKPAAFPGGPPWRWRAWGPSVEQSGFSQAGGASSHQSRPDTA